LSSSDNVKQAAYVVLMTERPANVLILGMSRGGYGRVIANFVWTAVYNSGAILLAAGAFVGTRKGS